MPIIAYHYKDYGIHVNAMKFSITKILTETVAESMVDAMNQGDADRSKHMFDILMRYMKEPDGGGKFALNFDSPKKTPPKSPLFT